MSDHTSSAPPDRIHSSVDWLGFADALVARSELLEEVGWSRFEIAPSSVRGFLSDKQDKGGHFFEGATLVQGSQSWERLEGVFVIEEDTRLSFDFASNTLGEIHGLMFTNGDALASRTTLQLAGSQDWGHDVGVDYVEGSGVRHYDIAVGELFTGTFDSLVFITDDDAGLDAESTWSNLLVRNGAAALTSVSAGEAMDLSGAEVTGFRPRDQDGGEHAIMADGATLVQGSQSWERLEGVFVIEEDTRLSFDFASNTLGEIHGLMFTNGDALASRTTLQLAGSQDWGHDVGVDYVEGSGVRHYDIAVGELFTGTFDSLVFITDDDAGLGAESTWANIAIV